MNLLFLNKIYFFVKTYFNISAYLKPIFRVFNSHAFLYISLLGLVFVIDSLLIDDEPLWEPLEWSLVQTWLFFIFFFAWVAENLITSRFGSYTGRDKRVWLAWYKTFWLIEWWYALSFGAAVMFVIVPFYYEITYTVSFIISWWYWFSRSFFFKITALFTLLVYLSYFFQISIRWFNYKKLFFLGFIINVVLAYLIYLNFIIVFFSYFTDILWYQNTRPVDYIQLSQEPLKWGWGGEKRDHFTYHQTPSIFWYKNDGSFASAMLLIHLAIFLAFIFLYLYWLILLRRIYTYKEVSYTYTTYTISGLKQFVYFYLSLYVFIIISFIINYWRYPVEHLWVLSNDSWARTFSHILINFFL